MKKWKKNNNNNNNNFLPFVDAIFKYFCSKRANLRAWTLSTKEVICRYHSKRWSKDFVKMCLMIRTISKDVDEIRNTTIGVGDTNPHPPPPPPSLSYTLNVRFYGPAISMIKYGTYVRCSWFRRVSLWVSSVYCDENNYKSILGWILPP